MVGTKREKSDAIVILTDEPKYSEAYHAYQNVTMLTDLGPEVRSIRCTRTRTGEMILEIKRDKIRKDAASHKCLAEKILDEGIEVRALTLKL